MTDLAKALDRLTWLKIDEKPSQERQEMDDIVQQSVLPESVAGTSDVGASDLGVHVESR